MDTEPEYTEFSLISIESESNARPSSPLTEIGDSRSAENLELQNANDRLASYIDRVRILEAENSRLTLEAKTIVESQTGDEENIKQMFDSELHEVRKVLNEVANEKSRLEIHAKRLFEENSDLRELLEKATDDLNEDLLYEQRYNELQAKYDLVIAEKEKYQYVNRELENKIAELMAALNDLRKHLEEEILVRVETENTAQSLREELIFKNELQT